MNESIDPFFNFNERSEVSEVTHSALNSAPDLIALAERPPRVFLHLLHAQTNPPSLGIHTKNLDFNGITLAHDLARMLDTLRPTHLRHMHETFNARFQLNKCTIVSDTCDFSGDSSVWWKPLVDCFPGVWQKLFASQ